MKWVTREKPKVDRVACPWLIRRFVDDEAELLFVPPDKVLETAQEQGTIPYDVSGAELGHREGKCTFEVIVEQYDLDDPALQYLARIVHGADTRDLEATPESAGLRAIATGWHLLDWPLERRLDVGFALYDALYAWCQHRVQVEAGGRPS